MMQYPVEQSAGGDLAPIEVCSVSLFLCSEPGLPSALDVVRASFVCLFVVAHNAFSGSSHRLYHHHQHHLQSLTSSALRREKEHCCLFVRWFALVVCL